MKLQWGTSMVSCASMQLFQLLGRFPCRAQRMGRVPQAQGQRSAGQAHTRWHHPLCPTPCHQPAAAGGMFGDHLSHHAGDEVNTVCLENTHTCMHTHTHWLWNMDRPVVVNASGSGWREEGGWCCLAWWENWVDSYSVVVNRSCAVRWWICVVWWRPSWEGLLCPERLAVQKTADWSVFQAACLTSVVSSSCLPTMAGSWSKFVGFVGPRLLLAVVCTCLSRPQSCVIQSAGTQSVLIIVFSWGGMHVC